MFFKIVFILSICKLCFCNDDVPEVKTRFGIYKGRVIKSRGGRDILTFQGIPYAQPPVGKLRFKEPVALQEREGTFEAKEQKECLQLGLDFNQKKANNQSKYIGSEDCLYLNIYVPKLNSRKELLPVYFWIHGGGYLAGAGTQAWNGPEFLLDENRDMVMVAVNYRLGILGFLSANDENLPGNLGLKDQAMALKWVRDNIKAFGGDPNSVTLGGQDAGGASVNEHLFSKISKGLFHRAISQSGTSDCSWARKTTQEARRIASTAISFLDCPLEPKQLLDCLQNLSADIIMDSMEDVKESKKSMIMNFVPVVEKDSPTAFMTKESINEGSKIPWLTGITNEEGLLFYQLLGLDDPSYFDLSILMDNYKTILPVVAYYSQNPNADKKTEELKEYYFGDKEFNAESAKQFVQLLSDQMFNHGFHKSTKNHKGKLYKYLLSYRGQNSVAVLRPSGLDNSVSHGDDWFYFFDGEFIVTEKLTSDDLNFSNTVLNMWYNFIKTGNPTPDTKIWKESKKGKRYLDFSNEEPVMRTDLFKERMDFLDNLERRTTFHDEL